ncbi:MAG: type II toxin-antitoxin system VapC family toxin [archaeon GB-1867-005]|nr:type II toxin-antitoxin system VapC family toxin [Candidatus Culexmicrobium cathedralense]
MSKKRYNAPYNITIEFIESIVLPYIEILPLNEKEYQKAAEILKTHNINPSDALHIATITTNNITKIASEDKEYDKIKEITRIWL